MYITELDRVKTIIEEGARNGMSLSKFIDQQITEFKDSAEYKEMQVGSRYFKNNGDIKDMSRTYIDKDGLETIAPHAKNYQLKHPFIYKMINQKAGYLLRKKPTIKQIIENGQEEDKDYQEELNKIFNNKTHKKLKNTLKEAVKRGIAWWQVFIDEDGDLKARLRYASRIVPMWQDEEHEILDAIIMFYDVIEYVGDNEKKTITKVEYWDLDGVRYYVYDGSSLIEDVEVAEKNKDYCIKQDNEGTSIFAHFMLNGQKMLWNKIPFVYFKYNEDEMPLIHLLKSLIDCYDELNSRTADSIFESPDGINVVENYQDDAGVFQKNLATYGTVFLDEGGTYDRKSVDLNIDAFKTFIEQLRKDIYEGGSCVDTQSDKFGTQVSGVALKQLYADLDLDCSNIETEFQSSLEYFMFFYNYWMNAVKNKNYSDKQVEFVFNKTMTVNEQELIQNCQNSADIISKKTILSRHPYVTNVEDEMKQIETEKREEQQELDNQYLKVMPQNKTSNQNNKDNGGK